MNLKNIYLLSTLSFLALSSCDNVSESLSFDSNESLESNTSIETSNPELNNCTEESFIFSNINDSFNENEEYKVYKLYADHDDTYVMIASTYLKFTIFDSNKKFISESYDELSVDMKKGDYIYLKVEKMSDISDFSLEAYYINNPIKLPYETNFKEYEIDTSYSNEANILQAATIDYVKRSGGTYIYSNNPEMFVDEDVNTCVMRNGNLTGEIYMAYEHANYSSYQNVYLGYKLVNEEDHDIYVTVENIGYQTVGTWFGQRAWYDFYNTKFKLPDDYLINGQISGAYAHLDYAYEDYQPRIFTPTTYKIPAHESFFVLGGSSGASYNGINVDNTANKALGKIRCCNGQVKFNVTNGSVRGMMFIYNDIRKINDDMEEVGYITLRNGRDYGLQYQGIAHHKGVIDNHVYYEFNDNSKSSTLPVTYTNKYALDVSYRAPYSEYENYEHVKNATSWMTHLNPQNNHNAVGSDMVEFICKTTDKKTVIIDNYHSDGSGYAANTANWMIEYHDNFTFVNRGNNKRTLVLRIKDHGTLATLLRDEKGNVLETYYSIGLGDPSYVEYKVEVEPLSYRQVCLDYLLVACSYGSVLHEVKLI